MGNRRRPPSKDESRRANQRSRQAGVGPAGAQAGLPVAAGRSDGRRRVPADGRGDTAGRVFPRCWPTFTCTSWTRSSPGAAWGTGALRRRRRGAVPKSGAGLSCPGRGGGDPRLAGLRLHPDKTKVVDLQEGREGWSSSVATSVPGCRGGCASRSGSSATTCTRSPSDRSMKRLRDEARQDQPASDEQGVHGHEGALRPSEVAAKHDPNPHDPVVAPRPGGAAPGGSPGRAGGRGRSRWSAAHQAPSETQQGAGGLGGGTGSRGTPIGA
jgi:hypothetical protein